MKTGIELIAEERARQVAKEGWTPEHDDGHDDNELTMAAAAYALQGVFSSWHGVEPRDFFPWVAEWWKPKDRIRNLTRAGALIAAEIDRLQRAADRGSSKNNSEAK